MLNNISITRTPLRKTLYNHFPSFLNTFFVLFTNCLNFTGSSFSLGTLTKKKISAKEIKLSAEIEKNGRNHKIAANTEPKMGLNTFPNVFDVSIIPKEELIF